MDRLDALIDDDPLPPTVPDSTDPLAGLTSASNITAMVANMKKQIEERKRALCKYFVKTSLEAEHEKFLLYSLFISGTPYVAFWSLKLRRYGV